MKSILLAFVAVLLTLVDPFPARASLGGNLASVQADQTHMRGTLKATRNAAYTVEELKAPTGIAVREYAAPNGQIFAVTWQGPARPDVQQLLGTYFQTFKQAVQAQKPGRLHRAPLFIKRPSLVVEMGGHMRWIVGRAYDPTLVPSNVPMEEIR